MTKRHLVIATRASPLALKQAEWVKTQLLTHHKQLSIDFLEITTEADRRLNLTLNQIGGKGLFVKELEEALLNKEADIAVHSMKDVPMILPPMLTLPVICERIEPRDAFISRQYQSFLQLPGGAKVGTASLRRQAQLHALRADVDIINLRGNINTRLKRLDKGEFDAIILAAAGLIRLEETAHLRHYFSIDESLPAAGQGALGIECREDDAAVITLIKPLHHDKTAQCVLAERTLCQRLEGGCAVPIAAYAQVHKDLLTLRALIADRSGRMIQTKASGSGANPEAIGSQAAAALIKQGAEKILQSYRL